MSRSVSGHNLDTDPRRSALMSRVRQRGTSAERSVAGVLRELRLAYRLNVRSLPGSPDFANRARRWALFVNGCFWHQHRGCRRATVPKRNREFWQSKFTANRRRDASAIRQARGLGLRVILVWECQAENDGLLRTRLSKLLKPCGI